MKTAVITGTSKGLGKATAERLLALGWKVVGLARSKTDIVDENFLGIEIDITNYSDVIYFSKSFKGKADLLINNAAIFKMAPFESCSRQDIDDVIDTNVKASMYMTRFGLEYLNKPSRIIFINSVAGLGELRGQSIYCASKYALTAFAGVLGKELREAGIRVSSIHPGGIDTPLWNESNPYPLDISQALSTAEVVRAVEFIIDAPHNVDYKTIKLFPSVEWH